MKENVMANGFEIRKVGLFEDIAEPFQEHENYTGVVWSLYVRDDEGLAWCVGDYTDEETAQEMLRLILRAAGSPDEAMLAQLWEENDQRL